MKKSVITHLAVMLIAIFAGGFLSAFLIERQAEIINGGTVGKAPLGGFNKFTSDVQWMLFVNYAGSLRSVQKENVKEIYQRLNAILDNDPNLEIAYNVGGMMLSVRDPLKAVDIFTRGTNNPNLKDNWKLPFFAAHILERYVTDKDDKDRLKKAEEMLRIAASRNPSMPYIFSALMRIRGQRYKQKGTWNNIAVVNDRHAYLCALFDEWRKNGGQEGSMGGEVTVDLKPMLLQACQRAKASAPDNKDILKTVDKVMKKVLEDQHLCLRCLAAYSAGDKFCDQCGNKVEPYGVCVKCKTVLKGAYCANCGHKK